jgi:hypothetical protein
VTFDFRGTWEVFLDAKWFYSRLGYPERMEIAAPDAPHGFTIQLREAVARWMSRWLLGKDTVIREVDALPDAMTDEQLRAYSQPDWTQEQLQCTPKGQTLLMPGERSVFQINAGIAASLKKGRVPKWRGLSDDEKRKLVRETIGARSLDALPAPKVETVAKIERDGYAIHKLVLTLDERLHLPALAFVPAKPTGPATLYLHGVSMAQDADGPIATLVKQGHIVLAAELRGIGETETGHDKRDYGYGRFGRDNQEIFTAYLMGKSFVGMRTEDVATWTRFLKDFSSAGTKPAEVHLIAIGEAAISALHAAALAPDAFRSVTLRQMIPSWDAIVRATETFDQAVNVVHGALKHYDLPDLADLAGVGKVIHREPADVMSRVVEARK